MKFKKFTNLFFLVLCWLFSLIFLYVFLVLDDSNYSVISYYLLASGISIIAYVIVSLLQRYIIKKWKCVLGTIKKCEYSYLSNCDLTYAFECDGKIESIIYHYSQLESVGKQENIYISKDNKRLYRERDIVLFSNKLLYIFIIIALIFIGGALYINSIDILENFMWNDYTVGEIFGYLFVIKFANLFPLLAIVIIYSVIKKNNIECIPVEATVVGVDIKVHSDFDKISDVRITRKYNMGTPKYEYVWNGKKCIYISNTSSTNIPKIGSTKKLFVDKDGVVVKENGEIGFLIIFTIIWLFFYFIIIYSVLSEIL